VREERERETVFSIRIFGEGENARFIRISSDSARGERAEGARDTLSLSPGRNPSSFKDISRSTEKMDGTDDERERERERERVRERRDGTLLCSARGRVERRARPTIFRLRRNDSPSSVYMRSY